jgi:hypothetical protein
MSDKDTSAKKSETAEKTPAQTLAQAGQQLSAREHMEQATVEAAQQPGQQERVKAAREGRNRTPEESPEQTEIKMKSATIPNNTNFIAPGYTAGVQPDEQGRWRNPEGYPVNPLASSKGPEAIEAAKRSLGETAGKAHRPSEDSAEGEKKRR